MTSPQRSTGLVQVLKTPFLCLWWQATGSLSSRIISSVFAVALITSLTVAWVSTQSIESFLREKINQKFPQILHGTSERIALWYGQSQLDTQVFASSAILGRAAGANPDARAQAELEHYLSFVLSQSPHFTALFVTGTGGMMHTWTGPRVDLSPEFLPKLGEVTEPRVSDIRFVGQNRVQVISSPIRNADGKPEGALHALVDLSKVDAFMQSHDLGESGRILLVNRKGIVIAQNADAPSQRERYERALPERDAAPRLDDYVLQGGERVVGSSLLLDPFGWTLVVEEDYAEAFQPVFATIRRVLGINLATVIAFCAIALLIARSITRPIQTLSVVAGQIAEGAPHVTFPGISRVDEIGVLTRAFNEMTARLRNKQQELEASRGEVIETNDELQKKNEELQHVNKVLEVLSNTDELTGIKNHRYFQENLYLEMKRAQRSDRSLAMLLIDIDDFKQLNDRHGHSAGDEVLRGVAQTMQATIRETDVLARYGGEEFVLLLNSQHSAEGAVTFAEKIRLAIAQASFDVRDEGEDEGEEVTLQVTASIGVSLFRGDRKAFFNEADRALYRAKDMGKDCVVLSEEASS